MKIVRLIINWIGFITLPIWGGTVLIYFATKDAINPKQRRGLMEVLVSGEKFFWEGV